MGDLIVGDDVSFLMHDAVLGGNAGVVLAIVSCVDVEVKMGVRVREGEGEKSVVQRTK